VAQPKNGRTSGVMTSNLSAITVTWTLSPAAGSDDSVLLSGGFEPEGSPAQVTLAPFT
jgi:hypothetical protein